MGGGNRIIEYAFNDIHPKGGDGSVNPDFWLGNVKKWDKIMRKMKLPFDIMMANFFKQKQGKFMRFLAKRKRSKNF